MLDIREMLRRTRAGESERAIARALSIGRPTVKKYRSWGLKMGLLEGELPSTPELHALLQSTMPETTPPQTVSAVEPHREKVLRWRDQGVESQAIYQRLRDDHAFNGSYAAVWRFVRHLEPATPEVTVRIEVKPGVEGQVDFGYAGLIWDGVREQQRKAWVFVMTLSHSRHQYAELVFDQTVATWLKLHIHAFEYFGGVPQRIVLDNLKAAIIKACFEEPTVQRSYRELAEHYSFLIAPCRAATPEHKGKVESGVHYIKRNFLAGQSFTDITQANAKALAWVKNIAGQRIHGTTKMKPLVRFTECEKAALSPLPAAAYDLAVWKEATVQRDCYVVFENAYYSVPFRLVGEKVWVRGGLNSVGIYVDYQLVASHLRATEAGQRTTQVDHLPPAKVGGLIQTREVCQEQAAQIGRSTAEVVARLLAERPVDRLPMVHRILSLSKTYGPARLECACARALHFEDFRARTIRQILVNRLDLAVLPAFLNLESAKPFFARAPEDFLPGLGGVSWN